MRILPRLLALLVTALALLTAPATAALQTFTPLQLQILHAVMQQNGFVDQVLHDRFWREMSPEARQNIMANSIDGTIKATVGVGLDLERESWRSVRVTLQNHQLSYTTEYLLLLKQLSQPSGGRGNPFAAAIVASKQLIADAADGSRGPNGKPITEAQVDAQLAAVDATYLRIYALLSPGFPPPDKQWPLTMAGATVSWPFPFALNVQTIPAAGALKVPSFVYDVAINATDFVAIQAIKVDRPLDRDLLALQGRLSLGRLRIPAPKDHFAPFRDHDSVLVTGIAPAPFGKTFVSARLVQAHDDNRLVLFMASASTGAEAADALRAKLEEATRLDEGF